MAITTSDFLSLTRYLDDVFNEAKDRKIDEVTGNKLFKVSDTGRRQFIHQIIHGLGGVQEVSQGQQYPLVNSEEGDQITWTQRQFAARFAVTKQMRMFDLYDDINALARTMTEDAFDKIDQSYADILGFGWSTSHTDVYGGTFSGVGPDGLALFSSVHSNDTTSRTYSNLIVNSASTADPVLARDPIIKTRAVAMVYKDPEGHVRPTMLDTIVVTPTLEDAVERILYSNQLSGSANNDINPLKGKITKLIVYPRLTTLTGGTDASAYWFMADSRKVGEALQSKFSQRPQLMGPDQVFNNKDWEWTLDYLYTNGIGFQQYIWGSRGTAA